MSSVTLNGIIQNYLDANALYDVRTVFHVENLESFGLQIFSRVLIEDGESRFSFGRIAEPTIVGHKWSPIEESTRDCFLGVLLNTGEVLILKRDSLDASEYDVKFRSFTCLLDQMHIPQERLTAEGDIILRNDQYMELKVTDFEFAKLPNGQLIVSLAHESGEVTFHKLEQGFPLLERFQSGGLIMKQVWSESSNCLFYTLNDNSVHKCPVDENGRLRSPPTTIKSPSRFLVSQFQYSKVGQYLALVDTKLIFFLNETGVIATHKLPFRSTVSSLPIIETDLEVSILIAYETGQLIVAKLKGKDIIISEAPSAWKTFINKTLYKYQLLVQKEKDKALSQVFLNFLADTAEANFCNYGTQLMVSNGTLVTVFSLSPKHTIHHEIRSRMEFTVSFLSVREIEPAYKITSHPNSTSLSKLSSLFIEDIKNIPIVSGAVTEGKDEATKLFLESIKGWKTRFFPDPSTIELRMEPFSSLKEGLILNFRNNSSVLKLQELFTANVSLLKTIHALNSPGKLSDELSQLIMLLAQDQDTISLKLRQHLSSIFMQYLNFHSKEFQVDIDKFMFINYFIILRSAGNVADESEVPNSVKFTISTDICTENFEVSKNESVQNDFLKYLNSTTDHKWPRCDLTFVPILELASKSDQLELHNYSNYKDLGSELFSEVFDVLNYCVYSGNRTFNTKVGV